MTAGDRIAPLRRGTGGLLVLTGFVEMPHQLRAALAGHPHAGRLDARVQIPATAVRLDESVEGGEQVRHDGESSIGPRGVRAVLCTVSSRPMLAPPAEERQTGSTGGTHASCATHRVTVH